MASVSTPQSARATAASVLDQVRLLQGELDASKNPHRRALEALGVDRLGWAEKPYNDNAFRIWSDLLKQQPDDPLTLHHLAIMHHSRAVDLEAGPSPRQADADWEKALGYWRHLYKDDAFWDHLAEMACRGTKRDAVDNLRAKFPELLAQFHFDIAFAPATQLQRAQFHIRMALDSNLPPEAKTAARREAYTRCIRRVEDAVWQIDMLDPTVIKRGTDVIEKYLELDPGCRPALEDALRLQVRLVRARYPEYQSLDQGSPERKRLLQVFEADADHWRPYFDQLTAEVKYVEDDIRQKLCHWYRVMGDVLCALDKEEKSLKYYEQGIAAGIEEDDEQKSCQDELGQTHAYLAREKAHKKESGAKAYCDSVRRRRGLSITAHFLLANAYSLLKEFDTATEVCRVGMAIEPDTTDYDQMAHHEEHREKLADMLESIESERRQSSVKRFLDEAKGLMDKGDHRQAVPVLDKAVAIHGADDDAYFLRCQCYLSLGQLREARADLQALRKACAADGNAQLPRAVAQLEKEVIERSSTAEKFGERSLVLRQEAVTAANSGDFPRAAARLREAIVACTGAGLKDLERELAVVLSNWAVSEVNRTMKDKDSSAETDLRVCHDSLAKLEEADRLDRDNSRIAGQIRDLRELITTTQQRVSSEQLAGQALGEFGGEEALQLRGKAVAACNAGNHKEAIRLLREAMAAADRAEGTGRLSTRHMALGPAGSGTPKLRQELALVLAMAAVALANEAAGNPATGLAKLQKAKDMLEEAVQLDPSNEHAQNNLTALCELLTRMGL